MNKTHRLKTLQPYFMEVKSGIKKFELRSNDRNFQVGDIVVLSEWDGLNYMGDSITVEIKYVLENCPQYGLMQGYCIFGW